MPHGCEVGRSETGMSLILSSLHQHPGFAATADMEEEENRHPPVKEDSARGGEKPAAEPSLEADWDQSGAFCAGQVIILVMTALFLKGEVAGLVGIVVALTNPG